MVELVGGGRRLSVVGLLVSQRGGAGAPKGWFIDREDEAESWS